MDRDYITFDIMADARAIRDEKRRAYLALTMARYDAENAAKTLIDWSTRTPVPEMGFVTISQSSAIHVAYALSIEALRARGLCDNNKKYEKEADYSVDRYEDLLRDIKHYSDVLEQKE